MLKITVRDLRQRGFKVTVHHTRHYTDVKENVIRQVTKHQPDLYKQAHARGGETAVNIFNPRTNQTYSGLSICNLNDNYNKKLGVNIALYRALWSMGLKVQPRDARGRFLRVKV